MSDLFASVSWGSCRCSLQTRVVLPPSSTCTFRDLTSLINCFRASNCKQSAYWPLNLTSGSNLSASISFRIASSTHLDWFTFHLPFLWLVDSVCTTLRGWWKSANLWSDGVLATDGLSVYALWANTGCRDTNKSHRGSCCWLHWSWRQEVSWTQSHLIRWLGTSQSKWETDRRFELFDHGLVSPSVI